MITTFLHRLRHSFYLVAFFPWGIDPACNGNLRHPFLTCTGIGDIELVVDFKLNFITGQGGIPEYETVYIQKPDLIKPFT